MTVALIHRDDYDKPVENAIRICDGFDKLQADSKVLIQTSLFDLKNAIASELGCIFYKCRGLTLGARLEAAAKTFSSIKVFLIKDLSSFDKDAVSTLASLLLIFTAVNCFSNMLLVSCMSSFAKASGSPSSDPHTILT